MKLTQMKKAESLLFPTLFIILMLWMEINSNNKKKNIQQHGKTSVGKYLSHETGADSDFNYFVYYIYGKRYKVVGGVPEGFYNNVGKFYKIKYLEDNPEDILVLSNEEVTDTMQIIDGGFSKDRILNISSSSYLFPDNK